MSGQLPPPPSFPPQGPLPSGPPPQGPPPGWGPPAGQRPPGRNRGLLIGGAIAAAVVLVLVIVGVAIALSGGDDDPVAKDRDADTTEQADPTPSTEPTESATPSEELTSDAAPVETPSDLPTDAGSSVPAEDLAFTFPDTFRGLPLDVAESDRQVDRTRVGSTAYYDREDGSDLSFIWYPDNTLDDYLTYQGSGGEKPTDKVGSGRCHPDLFGAYCVIELAGGVLTVADSSVEVELTAKDAIAALEEMAALVE